MKKRLDQLLVEQGLFPSRNRAQAAILAGLVYINGQKADKAGGQIGEGARVEVRGAPHPYVGRGGLKLEKALREFRINVSGRSALDLGASTGGFTDCLLQQGAARVFAVDVGYGQLAWSLRQDPRVEVIERTNARELTPAALAEKAPKYRREEVDLAVIDLSFISLAKVLPAAHNLLADRAEIVALIKPQFEARREQVGRGGIVRSEEVRSSVIEQVKAAATALGFQVKEVIPSPITGADGNVEYLIHLGKGK